MAIVDESIIQQCRQDADAVSTTHDLDQIKSKYLGSKSAIRESLKHLATLWNHTGQLFSLNCYKLLK